MSSVGDLSIDDFTYDLPEERIARFPLEDRDASKLLLFRSGLIEDKNFSDLPAYFNSGDLLIANQTRVVRARLEFHTESTARIELFCLEPGGELRDIPTAMLSKGEVLWRCLVGNARKWKENVVLTLQGLDGMLLKANLVAKEEDSFLIRFQWEPSSFCFAEVLEKMGVLPLPPYLKRNAETSDLERYQTVFAKEQGSVAAPTAGLHFTDRILNRLREKGVEEAFLTLHVGAGTFKPVKAALMKDHHMHSEEIVVNRSLIEQLASATGDIVVVGTTSLRSLESLYWTAVRWMRNPQADLTIDVSQWEPYESADSDLPNRLEAFQYILNRMKEAGIQEISGFSSLMIAPSYKIRCADRIITNFHQPKSTLLLLVSACIGDSWKDVYTYALQNEYRFLSYGDSSMLYIQK